MEIVSKPYLSLYSVAEIGHDPFELASYLTAKYFDYTLDGVWTELEVIFDGQYTLTITEDMETHDSLAAGAVPVFHHPARDRIRG